MVHPACVCSNVLPCRQVQAEVCELLSGILARMLGRPAGTDLAPVGAMLPALLSRLAEGIEAEHTAGRRLDAAGAQGLLAVAAQLTTGAPKGLRPYLRQVGSDVAAATPRGRCPYMAAVFSARQVRLCSSSLIRLLPPASTPLGCCICPAACRSTLCQPASRL